jgi:hypothetical protein
VRATLLLCDAAQVADGKLFVLGWGWTTIGPDPTPTAIALRFDVSWTEMDLSHHWELYLVDEDGQPVTVTVEDGIDHPIEVRGDFQVPRNPDMVAGSSVSVPVALHFGPIPLEPGRRYNWRLTVDGDSEEAWGASFSTRPREAAE